MPDLPALEAALAWYASPETKDLVAGLRHGHVLAAALAEMRGRTCVGCKWLIPPIAERGPLCEIGVRGCHDWITGRCGAYAAKEQP